MPRCLPEQAFCVVLTSKPNMPKMEALCMARPFHSITSSARASSVGGTSRSSAFAVVRLMTRSNLVGCSTGMSAGLVPRKILSIEQPRYFLRAQHHRQLARLVNEMCVLDDIVALERDPEEEPQC
jgi:hypothetical protein